MLGVVLAFVPVVLAYQAWVHRRFSGEIAMGDSGKEEAR